MLNVSAAKVLLGQEAPPALLPRAMHKMRTLHDRAMNDYHLPNDRLPIHDPVFHDGLNNLAYDGSFHHGLHNLTLNDATLDDGLNNPSLNDPALEAGRFVVLINVDVATSRPGLKLVVFDRVAATVIRAGCGCERNWADDRESANTAEDESSQKGVGH
jgi:hypothetical protein